MWFGVSCQDCVCSCCCYGIWFVFCVYYLVAAVRVDVGGGKGVVLVV